jgi:hypothetical protein
LLRNAQEAEYLNERDDSTCASRYQEACRVNDLGFQQACPIAQAGVAREN